MKNLSFFLISAISFLISSCASTEHKVAIEPKVIPAATPLSVASSLPMVSESEKSSSEMTIVTKPIEVQHKPPAGIPPEQALKWLKNGNRRFVKGFFRNDGVSKKDIDRLATGQKPHTIILSCSDSRVPPEVIFDQKLGEVFVVRTAGEVLDFSAIGSIEYAVEHLNVRHILVMGHTQCGAVKAALATLNGDDAGTPSLNKLVADIHPRIAQFSSQIPSKDFAQESWANTDGVAKDLMVRSALISEKIRNGDVKITTAVYHLDLGQVEFKQ